MPKSINKVVNLLHILHPLFPVSARHKCSGSTSWSDATRTCEPIIGFQLGLRQSLVALSHSTDHDREKPSSMTATSWFLQTWLIFCQSIMLNPFSPCSPLVKPHQITICCVAYLPFPPFAALLPPPPNKPHDDPPVFFFFGTPSSTDTTPGGIPPGIGGPIQPPAGGGGGGLSRFLGAGFPDCRL